MHPGDWFSQNVALGFRLMLSRLDPDLIVVDHSASCLPPLKWRFPRAKFLFYCHFPQQLVTPSRFFLYRWYSSILALFEELLFERADLIMMNSEFTGGWMLLVVMVVVVVVVVANRLIDSLFSAVVRTRHAVHTQREDARCLSAVRRGCHSQRRRTPRQPPLSTEE